MISLKRIATNIVAPATILLLLTNIANSIEPNKVTSHTVFNEIMVHFNPDSPLPPNSDNIYAEDSGRVMLRDIELPVMEEPHRITAHLTLKPIPKESLTVHDIWDRAGSIRLRIEGQADIEVIKFMTAYGGLTEHHVDVTHLAPLLSGERTLLAFIDTWVTPGWLVDFSLEYEVNSNADNAVWAAGAYFEDSFDVKEELNGSEVKVRIPDGMERVVMNYFSTGHCTDGRDADEFISKANVISVDGIVVYRFHPWRDDCKENRHLNPYTKRWSDGYWSSDYDRSGWCPGRDVPPVEIDLTDHLTQGDHTIRFMIEDMRQVDEDGNYGFWRVSAHLVGWDHKPDLWKNDE